MTIIALLVAAALFVVYANGANDTFKGVATLYGSGTAGYRGALLCLRMAAGKLILIVLIIATVVVVIKPFSKYSRSFALRNFHKTFNLNQTLYPK